MDNFDEFSKAFLDSLYAEYQSHGIKYDLNNKDFLGVLADYFSLLDRLIRPFPRKVKLSDTLLNEIKNDDRLSALVLHFKEKMEHGDDINNHLSTTIFDSEYDDGLFNDWGIKHIHLSLREATTESQMHSLNRSNDLLMAVVNDECAYFLTVRPHGDWYLFEYLEIIERNWKEELLVLRTDVIAAGPIPKTNEEIKSFRSAHVNCPLYEINGKYYTSRKLSGYMLNGQSMDSVIEAQRKARQWKSIPLCFCKLHFSFGDPSNLGWIEDADGNRHAI